MQRRHVSVIVVSLLSFVLCACEEWREIVSEWREQQQPPDDTPTPPQPSIESGQSAYDLGGNMLAVASALGVQIVDVSDLTTPRIVSEYRPPPFQTTYAFYHSGDSLVLITSKGWEYWGGRSEISATHENQVAVVTIDIHDRANPVLVDTWVLSGSAYKESRLRQSAEGAELYIHTSGNGYENDFLEWMQLRDGHWSAPQFEYVIGQYHGAVIASMVSANPTWLVISSEQALEALQVWRIDAGQPVAKRYLNVSGHVFPDTEMQVVGDRIHVPYAKYINDDIRFVVDSYVLGEDYAGEQGSFTTGTCDIVDLLADASVTLDSQTPVHFLGPDLFELVVDHAGSPELRRFSIDEQGACHAVPAASGCSGLPPIAAADLVSNFYALSSQQSIAVEQARGSSAQVLSLYGTTAQSCPAPSASIDLGGLTLGTQATRLARSVLAPDGTRETGLVSLPCYDPLTKQGCFQLVSYSDQTLTPRANIELPGGAARAFSMPDAKLALSSNLFVNTYDVRQLDAARELGSVQLAGFYPALFGFGDYIVRIQSSSYGELPDQIEVLPLSAAGERDPVITRVDVGKRGEWQRVDSLLVKVERSSDSANQLLSFVAQVYDLSDPTQPRRAGRLQIDPVRFPRAGQYDGGRAVGHALVYAYADPDGSGSPTFDLIDLRNPDAPVLVSGFSTELAATQLYPPYLSQYVSESTLYESALYFQSDGQQKFSMRSIDFSDPRAPLRSPIYELPGAVRLVVGDDLYTNSDVPSATVTRLRLVNGTAEPQATRTLPNFQSNYDFMPEIVTDQAGHLFVLYQPGSGSSAEPSWAARLFVLDDQTLEVLSSVPIDSEAEKPRFSNGRLLVEGPGVSFVVDVREPASPRVISYLRIWQSPTAFIGDRIFAYGGYGIGSFEATLQNIP